MSAVVLLSASAPRRTRDALLRALERMPARVDEIAPAQRVARLRDCAADPAVTSIVLVDDDAVLLPAAFASLARARAERPAIVSGQAHVDGGHRFGASFAAPRSGPDPFELVPIQGLQHPDRAFVGAVRGPIDVPQRGVLVVDAAFARDLASTGLDPDVLFLDLAVAARAAGRVVFCEPALTFAAEEDPPAVQAALGRNRRFAHLPCWDAETLHRDPAGLRSYFVHREVRAMGDVRGYQRIARPAVHVLLDVSRAPDVAALRRAAERLAPGGSVETFAGDGETLRRRLGRTGDCYLLIADADTLPDARGLEALIERVERSGRHALAVGSLDAPFGPALAHLRRIVGAASFAGDTATAVLASALRRLPALRLFGAGPAGTAVGDLAPLPKLAGIDVVYLAASKPEVTSQTVRPLVEDPPEGSLTAIIPAGNATTDTLLAVFAGLRVERDALDPHLAGSLNRELARCTSDAVLIARDDVQIPRGTVAALRRAFERLPRLGAAVPRLSGSGRPESLPEVGYQSISEMQAFATRRASEFARESFVIDVATAPLLLVRREALETVGGFDERYGFSQYGIADFTRRLRAANYLVARCDDAYAHVLTLDIVESPLAELDRATYLRDAYEAHWARRDGFDPATDRIALGAPAPAAPASEAPPDEPLRVLVPIADAAAWQRFHPHLVELAATLRASDPVEIAIGLDGSFALPVALAAIREVLVATAIPFAETLNVALEAVTDLEPWRDARPRRVRLDGFERPALAGVTAVADVAAIRATMVMTPA